MPTDKTRIQPCLSKELTEQLKKYAEHKDLSLNQAAIDILNRFFLTTVEESSTNFDSLQKTVEELSTVFEKRFEEQKEHQTLLEQRIEKLESLKNQSELDNFSVDTINSLKKSTTPYKIDPEQPYVILESFTLNNLNRTLNIDLLNKHIVLSESNSLNKIYFLNKKKNGNYGSTEIETLALYKNKKSATRAAKKISELEGKEYKTMDAISFLSSTAYNLLDEDKLAILDSWGLKDKYFEGLEEIAKNIA